jgi:D-arabinose 1-dehydrogenase-like Zn-dependent alcohol dehydrogenase
MKLSSFRRGQMKAARILQFVPPSVITNGDLPQPEAAAEQLLVRVKAAGVGNWDALIREGKVALQRLPLILGSDLSGIVEEIGAGVSGFKLADEVYGATNEQFSGAYAEYAVPFAREIRSSGSNANGGYIASSRRGIMHGAAGISVLMDALAGTQIRTIASSSLPHSN